jgi:hypothetical protein
MGCAGHVLGMGWHELAWDWIWFNWPETPLAWASVGLSWPRPWLASVCCGPGLAYAFCGLGYPGSGCSWYVLAFAVGMGWPGVG